mmetsp:Transcript_63730/g.180977  ORF Transcript_63730/g.180977 Transcript_63730/m.180977 type:complete len:119 (+) Transcript_63730:1531-1887(+)
MDVDVVLVAETAVADDVVPETVVLATVAEVVEETVVESVPEQMYFQVVSDCVSEPLFPPKKTIFKSVMKTQLNAADGNSKVPRPSSPAESIASPKHSDELDTSTRPISWQVVPPSKTV